MNKLKLDRSRHYAESSPGVPGPDGRISKWSQDGFYFDVDGDVIDGLMSPQDKARYERMLVEQEAERKADEARRKALAEAGIDPDSVTYIKTQEESSGSVDLRAWVLGKRQYPWATIREAVRNKYGFSPTTLGGAKQYLIEQQGYDEPAGAASGVAG